MKVNYNKLWKILIDKEITKTELRIKLEMSTATLAKMNKNEIISMSIIMRICEILNCNIGDIMDFVKEEKPIEKENETNSQKTD